VFEYILISLTACNFFFITFENLWQLQGQKK
jgi:hypothetical protein